MLFSRSSLLYWTEALRSKRVEITRHKHQKEQREIFLRTGETNAIANHPSEQH